VVGAQATHGPVLLFFSVVFGMFAVLTTSML
jgi:hypothetical protein